MKRTYSEMENFNNIKKQEMENFNKIKEEQE